MKTTAIPFLLLVATYGVSSLAIPRETSNFHGKSPKLSRNGQPQKLPAFRAQRQKQQTLFASTSTETKSLGKGPASIAVGVITAAMGFLYGKVLGLSVSTIWSTVPSLLLQKMGSINPTLFITGTCTLGGLMMGILSSKLSSTFAVSDFVSAFSQVPADTLPSSKVHLLPLLLLSLVTSSFGFSVGPEAPMVCAGALVGASLAKYWYGKDGALSKSRQETLAYAGAAGALTAFMGIPIAGSIFALELTRSNAGISQAGDKALSPSILASVAALAVIRGLLVPSKTVGGHFSYGAVGALSGRAMMTTAVVCGVGGALVGTVFHKLVSQLKDVAWPSSSGGKGKISLKRQVLVKTVIGLLVGIISSNYPQTLFWGEGSLQCMLDGQATAFGATKHGLSDILTSASKVNPSLPFSSAAAAFQVGLAKLFAIALACAGKFPGGIIFPLFFAAAPMAHASCAYLGLQQVLPVAVMCLMAATQASVTRTPLATALILSLTASASTELSAMLPACLVSSYLGVYLSQQLSRNSYFHYNE
jgi:H+/Cl- antiporter ClcA